MTVAYQGDVDNAMRRKWNSLQAVFVILATVTLCRGADSQGLTDPLEPTVTVQGVLQVGEFLERPLEADPTRGFSVRIYYLQLPATVLDQNPDAIFGPSFDHFDDFFVQLAIFPNRQPKHLASLIGKKVKVIGTARARGSSAHRTGMLLLVDTVSAVSAWSWANVR